jgi:uncharacterized phage protein gp47/JayE
VGRFPTLKVRNGQVHDLVVLPAGSLSARWRDAFDRQARSSSLLEITADPTLADETTVDQVLSNYFVIRAPGDQSSGEITVVVSRNQITTVAAGTVFVARGQEFVTLQTFTARPVPATIVLATDRILTPLLDGNYGFNVTAQASDVGTAGNITRGTAFTLAQPPTSFVRASAATDFIGGQAAATNQELLDELNRGVAAKTLSGRPNMTSLLLEVVPGLVYDSVVGLGDAEMLRDRRTIVPFSIGGRMDWYLRTSRTLVHVKMTLPATLLSVAGPQSSTWQVELSRDDYPGLYEVRSVLPKDSALTGTLEILADVRGLDLAGDWVPDVQDAVEGAFTRYQTVILRFQDDVTNVSTLTVGDTADYDVVAVGQPDIDTAQDYIVDLGIRHFGADALVKAAVPCFVELAFTIQQPAGQAAVDTLAIQQALSDFVNGLPFLGRLAASQLADIIHDFLEKPAMTSAIQIVGRTLYPNGTARTLVSTERLDVPSDPANLVSRKTTTFYLDPADVHITLERFS